MQQRADQHGVQPADLVVGLDLAIRLALAHGIAEQHAAQAEAPGVLLQPFGQAALGTSPGVQAPADAGAANPALQGRQVSLGDGEAGAQRRHVEQVEHFADPQATVGQAQQVFQGDQQRLLAARLLVGQGEGNVARVVALVLAEHRLDRRGVAVDVRQHDDDVARAQAGVGGKAGEQLVVEDFHFALGAVRQVKAQRMVSLRADRRPLRAAFGKAAQVEDVVLQLAEQMAAVTGTEQVDALPAGAEVRAVGVRLVIAVEQVDVVTALLAPGGEQRVADPAGRALQLAAVGVAQQVLVGDDVAPVVLAGVVDAQQHLAEARQGGQRLDHLCRQRRDAEHQYAARQSRRALLQGGQPGDEAWMDTGAAGRQFGAADIGEQGPPECCLPA